ncbi:DUF2946 family protein [Chelatococcus reniformis]|uniref:DUF2946 domain-containing protein n=1 Tax=Chelatococcus reniformis TaxID=1494448 RepID=A0A916U7T6_9HYPH|nr:DUF2946 family protein [Chelatococcus reniformis]GGC62382.1 hypothetical protein GCM10010994_21190 [Chelatococcus reniformis]
MADWAVIRRAIIACVAAYAFLLQGILGLAAPAAALGGPFTHEICAGLGDTSAPVKQGPDHKHCALCAACQFLHLLAYDAVSVAAPVADRPHTPTPWRGERPPERPALGLAGARAPPLFL